MAEEVDAAAVAAGAAVQLIDGEGGFAADSAERFMAAAGVAGCGLSYAVVSIMGPQSSGTCVTYSDRSIKWRAPVGTRRWPATCLIKCSGSRVLTFAGHPHCGRSVVCSVYWESVDRPG
jgi:hypothetical protein